MEGPPHTRTPACSCVGRRTCACTSPCVHASLLPAYRLSCLPSNTRPHLPLPAVVVSPYRSVRGLLSSGWGDEEAGGGPLNPYYQPEQYQQYEPLVRRNLARLDEDRVCMVVCRMMSYSCTLNAKPAIFCCFFGQGCMKSAACWQAEQCCCLLARSSGWQLWSLLACLLCCCPLQVDYDLLDTLITHIDSTQGPGAILVFLPGVHMCGYPQMSSYSCMWPLPG